MTVAQQQEETRRVRDAMVALVGNDAFNTFMSVIREQREIVIEDLCNDAVASDERKTMAAIGELRCYKNILATHSEALAAREMRPPRDDEE